MGGPGSGGHNKRPASDHVLRGTWRKDRHGDVVPLRRPAYEPGAPPESLSEAARALRARILAEFEGWTPPEVFELDLALQASDRYAAAAEQIRRDGIVLRGTRGGQRPHPLLRVLHAEARLMVDLFRQLRLGR